MNGSRGRGEVRVDGGGEIAGRKVLAERCIYARTHAQIHTPERERDSARRARTHTNIHTQRERERHTHTRTHTYRKF